MDAWEAVEVMRMAIGLAETHGSQIDIAAQALDRAGQLGAEAAAEAQKAAITTLSGLVRVPRAHIRVRDHQGDDMYWPVSGLRLNRDLDRAGETHPIVRAGVLGEGLLRHWLIIAAVNHRVAKSGKEVARQSAATSGASQAHIPDYIWLDTAHVPEREY